MLEKIQLSRQRMKTLSSQTLRSRVQGLWLGLGLVIIGAALISAAGANSSNDSPRRLVLRSRSSFELAELSVELRNGGKAQLRVCDSVDFFENCKAAWKSSARPLTAKEIETLKRLSEGARLFVGEFAGIQVDLSFRWLEVQGEYRVAMLVTTLNPSFSEPGARKDLLTKLSLLERALEAAVK